MAKKNTGGNNMSVRITINGQEININGENGNRQRDDDKGPKVCPQCGDTIEGESKICASCDYNSDEDTMKDLLMELEELMGKLRIYKPGLGIDHKQLLDSIDHQIIIIRSGYGTKADVREKLEKYQTEKEAIVKKRKRNSIYGTFGCAGLIVVIVWLMFFFKNYSDHIPTPEEKIKKLIKEGNIGKAKAMLPTVDDMRVGDYEMTLNKMEIDSLIEAKNYDEAMRITKLLLPNDRLEIRKKIVPFQVNELINNKNFDEAREKANALGNIGFRDSLSQMIALAEKQVNEENNKKLKKAKNKRKTRKHA
jgi:predicted nucleic acid-binding Zn ribbon protein